MLYLKLPPPIEDKNWKTTLKGWEMKVTHKVRFPATYLDRIHAFYNLGRGYSTLNHELEPAAGN